MLYVLYKVRISIYMLSCIMKWELIGRDSDPVQRLFGECFLWESSWYCNISGRIVKKVYVKGEIFFREFPIISCASREKAVSP